MESTDLHLQSASKFFRFPEHPSSPHLRSINYVAPLTHPDAGARFQLIIEIDQIDIASPSSELIGRCLSIGLRSASRWS